VSLTAREIEAALAELRPALLGTTIQEIVGIGDGELRITAASAAGPISVCVGLRGELARIHRSTLAAKSNDTPPEWRALAGAAGATIVGIDQPPGDRCVTLRLAGKRGPLSLRFELFSSRPLWVLVDGDGRIVGISRPLRSKTRTLAVGGEDAPPRAIAAASPPPSRFPAAGPHFEANDSIERHYSAAARDLGLAEARGDLEGVLRRRLHARAARITGLLARLEEAKNTAQLRRTADLLSASRGRIARGASEAVVTDYFDPALPELKIPLDPALDLQTQIERLHARARRLDAGAAKTNEEIVRARRESLELERALSQLSECQDSDSIAALRRALEGRRLIEPPPRPPAPRREAKDPADGIRRFRSADGLEIAVGKNERQNDFLTFRVARGNDLWLHAGSGAGGSHVVVRLPKDASAPLETLLDAAALAVHFSKLRGAGRAEVLYTQRKHVSKPRGAPPGQVAVTGEKRLLVDLDRARLDRLLGGNRPELGESG